MDDLRLPFLYKKYVQGDPNQNFLFQMAIAPSICTRKALNEAITRGASGHKTFGQTCPSYMQNFIKIGALVLDKKMTLCNFNKDF